MNHTVAEQLPAIGTLWIGGELPHIERLCISSMVGNGHDVTLYAYDDVPAPQGVTVADAAAIIPRSEVFSYKKTGSYATFSDWFRMKMIARTGKIWLDADAALLRPFAPRGEYYFVGGEHKSFGSCVNNYILKMPPDSNFCKDVINHFDNPRKFLKYMAWHRSLRLAAKRAFTGTWDLSKFRWGVFGMGVLTELVEKHGLQEFVHMHTPSIVEGEESIFQPISDDDMSAVVVAHFFSSGLAKESVAAMQPVRGSIYDHLLRLYG